MNATASLLRVLPETVLTLTGVLVMLIEPLLPKQRSRAPLGWLAILGTLASIAATLWQFRAGYGTAFSGTVVNDPFSIFFHLLIASIVLVTLLVSLDYFDGRTRAIRCRRHDVYDLGAGTPCRLHRTRNQFHLHLHNGGPPQAHRSKH
jgi:NADH:ubiquinone oxidoreductase subunit 2 (subunit N)